MHLLREKVRQLIGPRWPRKVRLSLALLMAILGFVCYRCRLTSAHGFMAIGGAIILLILAGKIVWWQTRHSGQRV